MNRLPIALLLFLITIQTPLLANAQESSGVFEVLGGNISESGNTVTITSVSRYLPYCGTPQDTFGVNILKDIEILSVSFTPQWQNYYPYRIGFGFTYQDDTYDNFGYNGLDIDDAVGKQYLKHIAHGGECAGVQVTLTLTYRLLSNELTRPLSNNDRSLSLQVRDAVSDTEFETYAIQKNSVVFISNKQSANVSAVVDGIVTDIKPLESFDCNGLGGLSFRYPSGATGYSGSSVSENDCPIFFSNDPLSFRQLLSPFTGNPFLISITAENGTVYKQVATDVDYYISEGMTVSAGCWIGKSVNVDNIDVKALLLSLVALGNFIDETTADLTSVPSMTVVWAYKDDEYINVWNDYQLDPSDTAPCNRPDGFSGCLGDAELNDYTQWSYSNDVTFNAPGATLPSGATIYANPPFALDATQQPEMVVRGASFGNQTQALKLQLGQTTKDIDFSGLNVVGGSIKIDAASHQPDLGGNLYTVKVTNTGQTTMRIDYICVRQTNGLTPPVDPPPGTPDSPPDDTLACVFNNSSLDNTDSWTTDGSIGDGLVNLADGQSLSQSISANSGTYTLTVVTSVWAYNAYVPDDQSITGNIDLNYTFPSGSPQLIASNTFATFASSNTVSYQTTVTLTENTVGNFVLTTDIVDAPSGVRGVSIMSICLSKEGSGNGGSADGGEISGGIFKPQCTTIKTPTGNAISSWISWHWAKLNQFFGCDLMKLLNSMYNTMIQAYRTFGFSMRWMMAFATRSLGWLGSDLLPWFAGYFTNMTGTTTVYNNQNSVQCQWYDIFCHLTNLANSKFVDVIQDLINQILKPIIDLLLRIVSGVADIFFEILRAIISLVVQIIGIIFSFLFLLRDAFLAIINAYISASPANIPGLPSCTSGQVHALCDVYWVSEHTIFTGNGAYFIPILTGYFSIHMLLYIYRELTDAIEKLGLLS